MGFSLNTRRLRLRDYENGDAAVIRAAFLDPTQAHYNLTGQANEIYVEQHFNFGLAQRRWQPRPAYDLAAVLPAGTTIGFCGLKRDYQMRQAGQLSWHIGKTYWLHGYATEAAAGLLEFGFLALELATIEATAFADNAASIRVMEKIGLRPVHNHPVTSWWRGLTMGERRPVVSYQLRHEQWLTQRLQQALHQPMRQAA